MKRKSEQTSCLSQIKQLGLASLQYADANDSRLFPRYNFVHFGFQVDRMDSDGRWIRAGDPVGWHRETSAFVKSNQLFFCPSAKTTEQRARLNPIEQPGSVTPMLTTYRTVMWLTSQRRSMMDFLSLTPLSSIERPSTELYLAEVNWLKPNYKRLSKTDNPTISYHGEEMNYFFLDGRVVFKDMRRDIRSSDLPR
ncbi:MAG TPA: hypothetical protein PLO61_01100 [Fimbriimonadaceae bacterium]|nr:hypothetical protein [Fimbriimonadaceae bacterium]HRJ33746.1 hypothetical protein [Fimbriimonadaceae bacterium]